MWKVFMKVCITQYAELTNEDMEKIRDFSEENDLSYDDSFQELYGDGLIEVEWEDYYVSPFSENNFEIVSEY